VVLRVPVRRRKVGASTKHVADVPRGPVVSLCTTRLAEIRNIVSAGVHVVVDSSEIVAPRTFYGRQVSRKEKKVGRFVKKICALDRPCSLEIIA
jgi:hypothetical protein